MPNPICQDSELIFRRLRVRIAEQLQAIDFASQAASNLEASIATFVPSELLKTWQVSDYPFIEGRYVSVRDGHVYLVAGSTDDCESILAYRLGFLQSVLTSRGGIAVAISEDGWMASRMILYSVSHAQFGMNDGVIEKVDDKYLTRRSFPQKKVRAYLAYLRGNHCE